MRGQLSYTAPFERERRLVRQRFEQLKRVCICCVDRVIV
jgi:hypothetical protein